MRRCMLLVLLIALCFSVLPSAAQESECPTDFTSRLTLDSRVRVLPGDPIPFRGYSPGTESEILSVIPAGTTFEPFAGPECANGYVWWRLLYHNHWGWVAEGDGSAYWLEPLPPFAPGVLEGLEAITPANANRVDMIGQLGIGWVDDIAWLSNDEIVVDGDNAVWVYDAANLTLPPRQATAYERNALVAPLQITLQDENIQIVETQSGELRFNLPERPSTEEIAIAGDSSLLAYATFGESKPNGPLYPTNVVHIIDALSGEEYISFSVDGSLTSLDFSPDSTLLAVSTVVSHSDHRVSLWDVSTGQLFRRMESGVYNQYSWHIIAFSPDGTRIAGGGFSGQLLTWSAATGSVEFALDRNAFIHQLAFSDDGQVLASSTSYNTTQLWHISSGANLPSVIYYQPATTFFGRLEALQVGDSISGFWDVRLLPDETSEPSSYYLLLSPDRQTGIVQEEGSYKLVDMDRGMHVPLPFKPIAFLKDTLLLVQQDNRDTEDRFGIWEIGSASPVWLLDSLGAVYAVNPESTILALSAQLPGNVSLWDISDVSAGVVELAYLEDRRAVRVRAASHEDHYDTNAIAFSPDSRIVAIAGDPEMRLWAVETGELLTILRGHTESISALAFNPDGTLLASAGSGTYPTTQESTIRLWGIPAA